MTSAQIKALQIARSFGSVSNFGDGIKASTIIALGSLGLLDVFVTKSHGRGRTGQSLYGKIVVRIEVTGVPK